MAYAINPNPGSFEAKVLGCKCPVIDNGHGKGSGRFDDSGNLAFWITSGCKLHDLNAMLSSPAASKPQDAGKDEL